MSVDTLLTFVAASTLLSFAPGPDNIFVLTQSALHGKRAGLFITLGLCTGLIVHTTAVAFGLAAIFMLNATAFTLLKYTGAAYLLYLAWLAIKASKVEILDNANPSFRATALYRRGIIMNLSNPKIAIFFLAFLPQFSDPRAGSLTTQLLLLGGLFIVVSFIVFSLIAFLAGYIAHWLNNSRKAQTIMNQITALVFFGLALRLASSIP